MAGELTKLKNGVYRFVGGDGGGFCVEVHDGYLRPIDPGGEVLGVIRVADRTFVLNRWNDALRGNPDQTLQRGSDRFAFIIEIQPHSSALSRT